MSGVAAVAVHNDLAARKAAVAVGAADDEPPVGLIKSLVFSSTMEAGEHRIQHVFLYVGMDLLLAHVGIVLGGDHHRVKTGGLSFSSYSTVTWLLPSGRRYPRVPSFLTCARRLVSLWARAMG